MRAYGARFPSEDVRMKVRPLGEWSNAVSQTPATRAHLCQDVQENARGSSAFPSTQITEMLVRKIMFLGVWTFSMSDRLRNTIPVHTGGPRNARASRALPAIMHCRV